MASAIPNWTVPGVVTETRDLTTKDGKTVWAHSIKVMGMGGMFELQTKDPKIKALFVEGAEVVAVGRFEQFNGAIKFIVTGLEGPSTQRRAS
jgi:hypothetical protein